MEQYDHRVDAYIGNSPYYAQPILTHLRVLVHEASPLITETIKWSCPIFEYRGIICFMRAHKQFCAFGLWHHKLLKDPHHLLKTGTRGSFGQIAALTDLPRDQDLIAFIRESLIINDTGMKPAKING
jgi:hypothetical protein